MTLYCELRTKEFSILGNFIIKSFEYNETYSLWHLCLGGGDDLFIHDNNIIKLGISTDKFDGDNYDSVALVVNGFVKYYKKDAIRVTKYEELFDDEQKIGDGVES